MLDEQRRVSKELVKSITQNRSWQEVFRLKEPGLRKGRARGFLAVEPRAVSDNSGFPLPELQEWVGLKSG